MSIATTTSELALPFLGGRDHFILRRLHSLTGIVFGGYLVVHLVVNATLAQCCDLYQVQVTRIHQLPLLHLLEWTGIFLPILYHTFYGIWITLTGQPNVNRYAYGKNWFYLLQRISAIILIFFILFHVLSLKYGLMGMNLSFEPPRAIATIARHMNYSPFITWVVYPIGILASCFHLANGFWTAGITWGLTVSSSAQRRWGLVCVGLFVFTVALGGIALVAAVGSPIEGIPTPPPPQ